MSEPTALDLQGIKRQPKIYVFCNQRGCDGRGDWHNMIAIAEDGASVS